MFTSVEGIQKCEKKRLVLICILNSCFLGEILLINLALKVCLWLEDGQCVVHPVELKEVLNKFGH